MAEGPIRAPTRGIVQVIVVSHRPEFFAKNKQYIAGTGDATLQESDPLGRERVGACEIEQDPVSPWLADAKLQRRLSPRRCSARISIGRSSWRTWFHDQLCRCDPECRTGSSLHPSRRDGKNSTNPPTTGISSPHISSALRGRGVTLWTEAAKFDGK